MHRETENNKFVPLGRSWTFYSIFVHERIDTAFKGARRGDFGSVQYLVMIVREDNTIRTGYESTCKDGKNTLNSGHVMNTEAQPEETTPNPIDIALGPRL